MGRALRLGVLSTARIAVTKVIPGLATSERIDVVAIASRDAGRARAAAETLGIATAHASYDDLLADPDVDAVYVPLPNHLHGQWTIAAARAGKHVLCEKPLAPTVDEARTIAAECLAAGVVLAEAFMYRIHPQWRRVRALLEEGRIGTPRSIRTVFAYHNDDPDDIRNIRDFGGGALLDIGCYAIDVSRWSFGAEPEEVTGVVQRHPTFGTDVRVSAALAFPGDRQASFVCSTLQAPQQHVSIAGDEGHLDVEIPFNAPPDRSTRLSLSPRGTPRGPTEVLTIDPADQYGLQGDAFAASVLDGTPVVADGDNAVANLRVIERLTWRT